MMKRILVKMLTRALLLGTLPMSAAADTTLQMSDLVALQRWLVQADTTMAAPEYADRNADGVLDTIDVTRMKRELLASETTVGRVISVTNIEELFLAVRSAQPGDRIEIAPGTYDYTVYQGAQKIDTAAEGTADAPITLTAADPSNPPILTGTDESNGYVLQITGDYWIVENIHFTKSQKGVVFDNSNHSILRNCEVSFTGSEGVALRDGSSYCLVQNCNIHDIGTVTPGYGEGVYIGSSVTVSGFAYGCDYNTVDGCTFKNVAAEHVDVKEYTTGTKVFGCTFYGDGMTGANFAGSFIDIAGDACAVYDNVGYRNGNSNIVAAFEIHEQVDGWGYDCVFTDNTLYMDQPYGAVDTDRRMYVVDGWFASFSVKNNMVDYGAGLVEANSWEYYNSDYVTYLE